MLERVIMGRFETHNHNYHHHKWTEKTYSMRRNPQTSANIRTHSLIVSIIYNSSLSYINKAWEEILAVTSVSGSRQKQRCMQTKTLTTLITNVQNNLRFSVYKEKCICNKKSPTNQQSTVYTRVTVMDENTLIIAYIQMDIYKSHTSNRSTLFLNNLNKNL